MRPAVDVTRLEEFSDGTAAGLRSLVEIFLSDVTETTDALAAAVSARRAAEIELLAHRAGGASAACGVGRLSELLLKLEELARGGHTDAAGTLMRDVSTELAEVTAYLRDHLDAMDATT